MPVPIRALTVDEIDKELRRIIDAAKGRSITRKEQDRIDGLLDARKRVANAMTPDS